MRMPDMQLNPCRMVLPGRRLQSHRGGWIWSEDQDGAMTFGKLYRSIFIHEGPPQQVSYLNTYTQTLKEGGTFVRFCLC